ncbi:MAG: alpha-(1-_3)-arabinofuranosyltransferase family protein [Patescibacteria group bacterium]|jgi:hypothetical protein
MKRLFQSKHFWPVLIVVLAGLAVFTWFKGDLIFSYGDVRFNFSPLETFKNYFYTWSREDTGSPVIQAMPFIFYQICLAIWAKIGLPLFLFQRLAYYFLFVSGGLGVYVLLTTVFRGERRYLIGLLAALFYMFNIYALVMVWGMGIQIIYFYPFLPWLLTLFIRGIEGGKVIIYLLLFSLLNFLVAIAYSNASYVVLVWLPIFAYFIFYLFVNRRDRQKVRVACIFTALLVVVWLLLNLYWLVPFVYDISSFSSAALKNAAYSHSLGETVRGASVTAHLSNAVRLFGYQPFDDNFSYAPGDYFHSYSPVYNGKIFFTILSYTIPLLALGSLLFLFKEEKKEKRRLVFFLLFSVAALFLYKGSQPPFGGLYVWAVNKFSLFGAFRHPMGKFGTFLVLGYAVLIGYTLSEIYLWLKKKINATNAKTVLVVICVLLFVIYQYPFWQGDVFHEKGLISRSALVGVPDYYREAAGWLATQPENFRIYPVPETGFFGTALRWDNGYDGADPAYPLLLRSVTHLMNENGIEIKIWDEISAETVNEQNAALLMGLLNTKYAMVRKDVAKEYFNMPKVTFDLAVKHLEKEEIAGLKFDRNIGQLDFYLLEDKYFYPRIYVPTFCALSSDWLQALKLVNTRLEKDKIAIFTSTDPEKTFGQIRKDSAFDFSATAVLDGKKESLENLTLKTAPDIKFERINPTKYRVEVSNAQGNFLLVLSDSFNNEWKAYLIPDTKRVNSFFGQIAETWSLQPIADDKHFWVNKYANAWYVERPEQKEDFTIILEFWPQRLVYWSLTASVVAWLVFIIVLIIVSRKKRKSIKDI